MRATLMYKAGEVRIENVPDASIQNSTDALIRITRACICGSDLWPYKLKQPDGKGQQICTTLLARSHGEEPGASRPVETSRR